MPAPLHLQEGGMGSADFLRVWQQAGLQQQGVGLCRRSDEHHEAFLEAGEKFHWAYCSLDQVVVKTRCLQPFTCIGN
jgi:hypothetical protein